MHQATLLLILPSASAPGKAVGDGPSAWFPATDVGGQDPIPGLWLWPGPELAIAVI